MSSPVRYIPMRLFKLILILVVGGLLTYLTGKTKFQSSPFDAIIWGLLIVIGFVIVFWTISKDINLYRSNKRKTSFALTLLCLLFIAIIAALQIKIIRDFNKPTLLRVYYDGDFNGTGIDFKIDGTYIFDNSAIGMSDYFYGKYTINGSNITMDKDQIDNITGLKHLEVKEKKIEYKEGPTKEIYLFQVDKSGIVIEKGIEFRVTIDNRK